MTRRNDLIEQARRIREQTMRAAQLLPDEQALEAMALFDPWTPSVDYMAGDMRRQDGNLYRCLQAHRSQPDWAPDAAASLWVRIADPAIAWPDWAQPLGAHDAYAQGAQVSHGGKHWTSNVGGNVWQPGVYGWTEKED